MFRVLLVALLIGAVLLGCTSSPPVGSIRDSARPTGAPENATGHIARVKTTGYCKCGDCCGWHYSWFGFGRPVISEGSRAGDPKDVGITASRTRARPGVIAADTNLFPIGTVMQVPGYGWGRVEDVGGAIKGYHLDLYFNRHAEALDWGVRYKQVNFWRPPGSRPANVRAIRIDTASTTP